MCLHGAVAVVADSGPGHAMLGFFFWGGELGSLALPSQCSHRLFDEAPSLALPQFTRPLAPSVNCIVRVQLGPTSCTSSPMETLTGAPQSALGAG